MARQQASQRAEKTGSNVVELQSDLQSLQNDLGRIGKRLNMIALKTMQQQKEKLAAQVDAGVVQARALADEGAKSLNRQKEQLGTNIKKRPLTSCAMALGAGIVLGSVLRARRQRAE
jgi:ElaB/YqjD/DUF883 family membrane-anchored ribosome-binding protein